LEFLRQNNVSRELPCALFRLACTSAISAVLSFVAGLGDRHHENFMITADGRLLHVDYGYALGREPLDSVLLHYAVQGGRPVATLQYEELCEALGPDLMRRVFWPVARAAYLRVRLHSGLLVEMVYAAMVRDMNWGQAQVAGQRAWGMAQAFVAGRCVMSLSDACAQRFIHALLWHCARNEHGSKVRDELKSLCIRETTHKAVTKGISGALATGRSATAAVGTAAGFAASGIAAFGNGISAVARMTSSPPQSPVLQPAREPVGGASGLAWGVQALFQEVAFGRTVSDDTGETLVEQSGMMWKVLQ